MANYIEVFAVHPKAQEIYVVKGQPFIDETHAKNYANDSGEEMNTVKRPAAKKINDFMKQNQAGPDDTGENTGTDGPDGTGEGTSDGPDGKQKASGSTKK